MVFESLVVDLVNRFLGDFIENLDSSQLSLGIWGGDVLLNNLFIKENLFDDLDLPIRVVYGNVGQLKLKIPWKNLYTEPTVAILDGLYIIAVPNSSVAYDEQKEQKSMWDSKQKELKKIEEAKKKEAEKDQIKDAKQDSFAEKLVANVIKNLEVKVTNIHIRYEDSFSNQESPFSLGITLKEVSCQTTDENWNIATIKDNAVIFHKLLKLDSLSLYWNINPNFYKGQERPKILSCLKSNVADSQTRTDYVYVIEPMTTTARLKLHTKPEQDEFQLPKIIFQVIFEEISIALNKLQYMTLMEFLDSFERMKLSSKYRKYRPNVPKRKNGKIWWKFATESVLNELVRRRRKMWSWEVLKEHRDICRQYKNAYKQKLIANKPGAELLGNIEQCERKLDVLNITIMRRQAEMEVQKEGLNKPPQSTGWFGGWLSWKSNKSQSQEEKSVGDKVQELMTPDEKKKLYEAIGYQENVDTVFPKEFIAMNLKVKLNCLRVKLQDNSVKFSEILHLQLKNVETNVEQRPAAEAIRVSASMESLSVDGQCMEGTSSSPHVITCDLPMPGLHMIDVIFETNPLDGLCDTRVVMKAQPLKIMYHAATIISLADFFKPPESIQLVQLQAAAFASLERMKEQTVAGLQFAIEQQKFTEVSVQVQPFYVLVPETGIYKPNCRMMVLDLGQMTVTNVNKRGQGEPLSLQSKKSVDEVKQSAYDNFQLQVQSLQVLFINPGDNWEEARKSVDSPMHVLKPMAINVSLYKCLLEDVQLPKMRVIGELPALNLNLSDQRLVDMMSLFNSIPLPQSNENVAPNFSEDDSDLNVVDLKNFAIQEESTYNINKVTQRIPDDATPQKKVSPNMHQSTNIELKFEVKEICLTLSKLQNSIDIPTVKVVVMSLGTNVTVKPFDNHVSVYLGGVYLQHTQFKALNNESLINLINTPNIADDQSNLLNVDITMAQKKHPDFWTTFNGTLQKINISVSELEFLFHQEAILNLMSYFQNIQERLKSKSPDSGGESNLAQMGRQLSRASMMSLSAAANKKESRRRLKKKTKEVIDLALVVKLDNLTVFVSSHHKLITEMRIAGLNTTITLQKSMTCVESSLKDITILDKSEDTSYTKILYFEGNQVFQAGVIVFNDATQGAGYLDMKSVDTSATIRTGCMKVVFINKFVQDLLSFLNQFEQAKASIMEAGSAAKEKAAAAAQDLSQKATRVRLDVEIKAPVVIVPRNRRSHQCLVVDLGLLKVQNSFRVLAAKDGSGLPAMLDAMTIQLSSVKLFRASVVKEVLRSENLIMEPVNLSISITRNLSSSWYHGVPDVEINGKLQKFAISVDQGDLRTVLLILSENLAEGGTDTATVKQPAAKIQSQSSVATTTKSSTTLNVPQQQQIQQQQSLVEQDKTKKDGTKQDIHSTLKAKFDVECILVKLYTGGLKDELIGGEPGASLLSPVTPEAVAKTEKNHLALVELKMLSLVCDIKSDASVTADLSLALFQICDARLEKAAGITRMFTHANPKGGKDVKMMQLIYEQDNKANKSVDMKLDHLEVVLCLEFLLNLSDFYMQSTLPQAANKEAANEVSQVQVKKEGTTATTSSTSVVSQTPPGTDQSEMKVTFLMKRSNVIMVEDPMNPNTNALWLQMELDFLMRGSPALQTMKGSLKDLSIFSCVYSSPETTKSHILSPVTLELQSCAPYGKNPHIAVSITDVDLLVSASSIRIITSTLAPLSKPKEETVEDILNKIPKELWNIKKLEYCNYWFLKSTNGNDGDSPSKVDSAICAEDYQDAESGRGEQLILSSSRIGITLLGGYGKRLQPLVVTEIYINNFEAKNWTTKLCTSCDITLESAYYNEKMAAWEPIIEPVEVENRHQPWSISVSMQQNDSSTGSDEDDVDGVLVPPPAKSSISIVSGDVMQVTVTKSLLEVLNNLSHSFSDAYSLVEMPTISEEALAPYAVKNETGMIITVKYEGYFKCLNEQPVEGTNSFPLPSGESAEFQDNVAVTTGTSVDGTAVQSSAPGNKMCISFDSIYGKVVEENVKKFSLQFNEYGASRDVRAMRGEKRAFSIPRAAGAGEPLQVVGHTKISYGCRIIILKSVLKVTNKLPMKMDIFYKLTDEVTGNCGSVGPGESINLPCEVASAPPYMLLFKPTDEKYVQCLHPFSWQSPSNLTEAKFFECKSTASDKQSIFLAVKVEQDMIWHEFTDEKTVKTYNVVLMPSVTFKNLLPVPILCKSKGPEEGVKVEPGHHIQLTSVQPGESSLSIFFTYQNKDWTSSQIIEAKKSVLSVWTFESMDGSKRITLDLGVHSDTSGGHLQMSLYCPYWMINLTGQNLVYKASDDYVVEHPSNFNEVVFILLKRSSGSSVSKVALKVSDSDWSEKFSLDTAGSLGTVECKSKSHPSTIGVKITLASNGLTKIVTFTPFYMVINQANFIVRFKEHLPNSDWTEIKPGECIPYWPLQTGAKKLLVACIKNSALETQPFDITEEHTTLLKLYHDYGGVNVVCQRTEGATTITFQQYFNGFASVLLVNQSDFTVQYKQKESLDTSLDLPPQSSILYTWQNPLDKREFIWSCGDKKNVSDELIKDGIGDFAPQPNSKLYWVSFLDGMQRVLLFTPDLVLATSAQQAGELEQLDQEINLSLQGFGLSLVNNFIGKEVAYMGITSSGVIWEHLKRKRFKALKVKYSSALEDAYQEYKMELVANKSISGKKSIEGKIEADFGSEPMYMMKPHKVVIRRSFEYGVWIKYSTSKHSIQLHLKIHRLQLDSQLPGAVFPTVLAPVPPPKSVASESVPKPLVEFSAMIRTSTHSSVKQFKYCKLLIQEMAVKVDQSFLNAMVSLFTSPKSDNQTKDLVDFKRENGLANQTLMQDAVVASSGDVKNFFDMLHFSPLKIHLSFSLYGGSEGKADAAQPNIQWDVLGLFLQSVGVVLTDVQDVVFKLGYFERKFTFYSQSQLVSEITRHYSQQAIKQMYVLVLGLDVLGNPFGMIRGLAEGIESLFYEPYQGAIQGPEEFAEGLALGVRSLLGHAVGGAAGAVSRITGALGKGIATLTMDEDYQKKRREELNKRPADLKEGLARGGKGLVMGVFDGVTGIVTKPVEGAKQEGIGGFFKGMGKGLVGVFTRPASGVVDFASSSFEGIRRVAEQSEETLKLRPMRVIHEDKVVRPYVAQDAEGNQVLQDVAKGDYAGDVYIGHMTASGDSKCIFLVTDKHLIFASKGDIFGHWDCDWSYTWDQLKEAPSLGIKGIQIILKERQKKFLGNGSIGKIVNVQDKDRKQAEFLLGKMKVAMATATMK